MGCDVRGRALHRQLLSLALAAAFARAAMAIEPAAPSAPPPPPRPTPSDSVSFTDLRLVPQLGLIWMSGDFAPSGGARSTASDWKLGGGVSIYVIKTMNFDRRGLRRWGGFLWSVGCEFDAHDLGVLGAGGNVLRASLTVGLGYGVPFGFWNNMHFELMLLFDGGLAALSDHLQGVAPDIALGWGLGGGGRLGFFYTFDNRWQLGVSAEYRRGWLSFARNNDYTLIIDSDELVAGVITVGKRF